MDGLEEVDNIIVFGLTNRRELIDPALLRPGRYVSVLLGNIIHNANHIQFFMVFIFQI